MRYLLAFILLWLTTGCGSVWHLQRAEWHLKMAEKKGARITADTVYKEVRVIVPQVQTDSIFTSIPGDTVRITKDRLEIKYVRLAGEKVYIEGKCKPDTVKITVPVTVTRTIEAGYSVWDVVKWCLFVGVAVFLALQAVKFFQK